MVSASYLAIGTEFGGEELLNGCRDIGVVEHNERSVPAQFKRELFECGSTLPH